MPANLLILPLLAGFLFIRFCYFTRYRAQSLDGYRLLFEAATFGSLFLLIARICIVLMKHLAVGRSLRNVALDFSTIPYSATAAGSVLLAIPCAILVNIPLWESWRRALRRKKCRCLIRRRVRRYCDFRKRSVRKRVASWLRVFDPTMWDLAREAVTHRKRIALNWATRRQNNQLLLLLNDAVQRSYMVSVALRNRKVYIGYVKSAPSLNPADIYVRLYPVRSGYRHKEDLRFEMTTDYDPVLAAGIAEPMFVLLPMGDIETINPFNPTVYSKYFKHRQPGVPGFQ